MCVVCDARREIVLLMRAACAGEKVLRFDGGLLQPAVGGVGVSVDALQGVQRAQVRRSFAVFLFLWRERFLNRCVTKCWRVLKF